MYFKSEQISGKFTPGSDERIIGKVNLRNGLAALAIGIGAIAVILFLSYEHWILAAAAGGIACIFLLLIILDPTGILRKRSKTEEPDHRRE